MPRGFPISTVDRERIAIMRVELRYSVEDIHAVFADRVSFRYLQRICTMLDSSDGGFYSSNFLLGPVVRTLNRSNRLLTDFQQLYLMDMLEENVHYRLNYVTEQFISEFFNDATDGPSSRTINRTVHLFNYSRKVMTRRNIQQCALERLAFMERVQDIKTNRWIDIDETASSAAHFLERYGWSPVGRDALRMQFKIGNKIYAQ